MKAEIEYLGLSIINKVGIVLLALGALLVACVKWIHPLFSLIGLLMLILGLYFAFKDRKASDIYDGSTRHTNADLDGDD